MDGHLRVERLSPFDLLMPRTYVRMLLVFRTFASVATVSERLNIGLATLSKQAPWITGRVFPTTPASSEPQRLELRWKVEAGPLVLADVGSIAESYEALSEAGMPPSAFPPSIWPLDDMDEDTFSREGALVFGASVFGFADCQGIGLGICMHHNVTDATGLTEIIKVWAGNILSSEPITLPPLTGRIEYLRAALSDKIEKASNKPLDNLFASHPEYSRTPPSLPTEFAAYACKMFSVPISSIRELQSILGDSASKPITTNTLLCGVLWSAITRARMQRILARPTTESSRLIMATNARRHIGSGSFGSSSDYLGNAVLYSLATSTLGDLGVGQPSLTQALAKICDVVATSQSRIDVDHVSEVYSLSNRMEDYRAIFPGWDLFGSRDFVITSWANLDIYKADFGPELGTPEFIRPPFSEAADGVCIVMPRRRNNDDEKLDVMVMLRRDDLDSLEKDDRWKTLVG
ncbi:hypothetical protein TrVFT333_002359 [Trichoderma virens FT-333]|nr:hypothetical protein TrVFT333_002359 [Trichoderma virens FT-333]